MRKTLIILQSGKQDRITANDYGADQWGWYPVVIKEDVMGAFTVVLLRGK